MFRCRNANRPECRHGQASEECSKHFDSHRDTLEWKCWGLTEQQLKEAASPPSPITLLGLLRHSTLVECFWFEAVLQGKPARTDLFVSDKDPDADFNDLESHSAEEVLREWKRACEASHRNVAGRWPTSTMSRPSLVFGTTRRCAGS